MKFETIGFDEDHVHFMLQSVPKYSASQLFRIVKSITARNLFEFHPDIKKELWVENSGVMAVMLGLLEKELMLK